MEENKALSFLKDVMQNMPEGWLSITTHRLDIYNEERAKSEFLEEFEGLYKANNTDAKALSELPTAYDYIRLGHPLSCVLEWAIGKSNGISPKNVISFSSQTIAILAILRTNLLAGKKTQINYRGDLPQMFDSEVLRSVYGYQFELKKVDSIKAVSAFEGSSIFVAAQDKINTVERNSNIDFYINTYSKLGSVLLINGEQNESYVSAIQHVRRRETIAMTPGNCLVALRAMVDDSLLGGGPKSGNGKAKAEVLNLIKKVTGTPTKSLVGSSGLSIQYAIMMGLVDHAQEHHKGKAIKIVVPPNCYGGTNDQSRRVAACLDNVEIVDLPVDGGNDMVLGIDKVLTEIAAADSIPYIIAEIPTNPRVEVPDLERLKEALSVTRKTSNGSVAIDPVFILDQTFCPNVQFLGEGEILSSVRTISFSSGSKFPSGGKVTAGYCVGNTKTDDLMDKIESHLLLCDNEATDLQYEVLATQMPSMLERIAGAYKNTRDFVTYINSVLPEAKMNFVSEDLAQRGFTPSVFSMDLPTIGNTPEEKEAYKRALNLKLINLMITEIPKESKYCVSYGQLKGCYWTIPATSTQGTTKEGDKDYIVRASLSADLDLEKHKQVFKRFVEGIEKR